MAEERRIVTVLFADVVGSTALGEALDPEDVRALLGRLFAIATDAVERHGGRVEKFIGDAVMAVFGVPIAHDDDAATRAVRGDGPSRPRQGRSRAREPRPHPPRGQRRRGHRLARRGRPRARHRRPREHRGAPPAGRGPVVDPRRRANGSCGRRPLPVRCAGRDRGEGQGRADRRAGAPRAEPGARLARQIQDRRTTGRPRPARARRPADLRGAPAVPREHRRAGGRRQVTAARGVPGPA